MPRKTWLRIFDYLAEVGAATDVDDLCRLAIARIPALIPVDPSAAFFSVKPSGAHYIREALALSQRDVDAHNDYYWRKTPLSPSTPLTTLVIDWHDYRHLEFVANYLFPLDIGYSTGIYFYPPGLPPSGFLINRPRRGRQLGKRERAIFFSLRPHLHNLYSIHAKMADLSERHLYAAEPAGDCRLLSKREAEVARLLCQRLSAAEIATRLLISPRTVERHIANIYEKLRVRNRRQLLLELLGRPSKTTRKDPPIA